MPIVSAEPDLHERLAPLLAQRADGSTVALGELWREGPAALIFLRHFGCVGCAVQVDALRVRLGELVRLGVRVGLIGHGTPAGLRGLAGRERLDPGVELLTDPTGASHREAGLRRSWAGSWGPGALVGFALAVGRGYRQPGGLLLGHPDEGEREQQGGALVVARGGPVLYAYASERLGDLPDLSDVVEVCLRLSARGSPGLV